MSLNVSSDFLIRHGYTPESVRRAVQTGDLRLLRRKPEDDDGGASVREPRRPITPLVSGAAEMEEPMSECRCDKLEADVVEYTDVNEENISLLIKLMRIIEARVTTLERVTNERAR